MFVVTGAIVGEDTLTELATFETPPELFYDGLQRTSDGKSIIQHPLSVSEEEMFDKHRIPPKDVEVTEPKNDDDISVELLTKKVDEMLDF